MPDAIITSTASTFGTISGRFAADQSTITGTVSGVITGTLSGSVGVPGPQGEQGIPGPIGPEGPPGEGGTWGSIVGTLSDQTDLQTALDAKQDVSGMSAYLTKAGNLTGLTDLVTARDNLQLGLSNQVEFFTVIANTGTTTTIVGDGLEVFDGVNPGVHVTKTGIRFDDLTVQTTAYPGPAGATTWGSIVGTLSLQTDLQTALDGKYSTSNPAGYITSSALTGYATESFVTSQGYITSAALSPYLLSSTAASTYQTIAGMSSYLTTSAAASTYYPLTNPSGYITSSALAGYATESWVTSELSSYLTTADAVTTYYPLVGNPSAFVNTTDIADMATQTWVTAGFYPLSSNPAGYLTSASLSGYATESWVTGQLGSYLTTSAAASTYAALAGATFTGVVGFNGASGNVAAKSTGWFKAYTSGFENTDYSLQYDTGLQVVVGGSTVARIAASGILAPSSGITFSDATTQTTAGVSAATVAATYAPLASPALTGNPTAPTPATADNDTSIATTAFVKAQGYLTSAPVTSVAGRTGAVTLAVADVSGAAPLASPTFTGTPAAPTASAGTSTTQLATTAFVTTADNLKANLASPSFTGTPTAPTATAGTNTTQIATTAFVRTDNNCKVWVNFNGTGTVAIRASFNVTSITDVAVGAYIVNYTNAIAANAAGHCLISDDATTYRFVCMQGTATNNTTTSFKVSSFQVIGSTFNQVDPNTVMVSIFR